MAEFVPVEPFDIVIFGVTGDLSRLKLLPALFHRFLDNQIDETSRIIGVSRSKLDQADFASLVREACLQATRVKFEPEQLDKFLSLVKYFQLDATNTEANWADIKQTIAKDERPIIFYLAVAPQIYVPICQAIKANDLNTPNARIVLEKPIGTDLKTAREVNDGVAEVFDDHAIFRMDHYLGKETVQNLLVLRFANTLFEPLWSHNAIDHIQITVSETVGVEGRSEYYDDAGAVRDIVQNHLLQLLCLIAMEPPNTLDATDVRMEKIKVLRALKGFDKESVKSQTVRGQYEAGISGEDRVSSYIDSLPEERKSSRTETFAAIKTEISNWRWSGVPFYLRTGKRMAYRRSEIVVQFKSTPHDVFGTGTNEPNRLVLRLQPDEGMRLFMQVKEPGPGRLQLKSLPLDLSYARSFSTISYPDAYERLLMDVVRGNLALFMGHDEVEAAWEWTDNLLKSWAETDQPMETHPAGTDGPLQSAMLLDRDGRAWWNENE